MPVDGRANRLSFCPSCGRGVNEAAAFCASCGAPLQGPAPPPAYAPPPPPTYAPPSPPSMYGAPMPAQTYVSPEYQPAPMIVARIRPTGVAILAVLQFISAAFLALMGLFLTFGGTAFAAAMTQGDNEFATFWGDAIGAVFVTLGVLCLVGAALGIVIGRGLWAGRSWARILSLVFAWLGLAFGVLGALQTMATDPASGSVQLIFTGLYGFLIWYWTRPGVKAFFASTAPIQ